MPLDYKNYNPSFRALSKWIRFERAKGRCERCGVPNGEEGYWVVIKPSDMTKPPGLATRNETYKDGSRKIWRFYDFEKIDKHLHATGDDLCEDIDINKKMSKVVLTVAHLDHDTRNDDLANLKALCQWCHLSHDRKDNVVKRRYGKTGPYHGQIRLELLEFK